MVAKQANGFSILPVLLILALVMIGLGTIRQLTKPVPVAPPLYKVGDCIMDTPKDTKETWEKRDEVREIARILVVGKTKYRALVVKYGYGDPEVRTGTMTIVEGDKGTEKTECTKELNDPKTLKEANKTGEGK